MAARSPSAKAQTPPAAAEVKIGMNEGWSESLERLAQLLAGMK